MTIEKEFKFIITREASVLDGCVMSNSKMLQEVFVDILRDPIVQLGATTKDGVFTFTYLSVRLRQLRKKAV